MVTGGAGKEHAPSIAEIEVFGFGGTNLKCFVHLQQKSGRYTV